MKTLELKKYWESIIPAHKATEYTEAREVQVTFFKVINNQVFKITAYRSNWMIGYYNWEEKLFFKPKN